MKIAICDNEKTLTDLFTRTVNDWSCKTGVPVSVDVFFSAESFQFAWADDRSYDLLLLDIQMEKLNGMELARAIRQVDEHLTILFITGYEQYVYQGYEVSALNYLIKPMKEQELFDCLDRAYAICRQVQEQSLLIETEQQSIRIRLGTILYAESFGHYISVYTTAGTFKTKMNIGDLEKELDNTSFFRSHRSYIVNLKFVMMITKTDAILDSGVPIPVSREHWSALNQAFIRQHRENEK